MRDQTSYTSWSVAWDIENMSDENMLQDREIILVILAFQKCRGLKSKNSTVSTAILLAISSYSVSRHYLCAKLIDNNIAVDTVLFIDFGPLHF